MYGDLSAALPAHVLSEIRLALDQAALLYPGHGRVTIDAGVLRGLLEAAEGNASDDADFEALADAKAERIRKVLGEHKDQQNVATCEVCGAPTDGMSHYESPVPPLCEAVDNLLDDL